MINPAINRRTGKPERYEVYAVFNEDGDTLENLFRVAIVQIAKDKVFLKKLIEKGA